MGCTLQELTEKLPPEELELRLVHQMNKLGYSYDQTKRIEAQRKAKEAERNAFLQTCPWNKNNRTQ
ncbi:hypothetical protein [Catenovulum sediminis]|uniref:Uncharacterized protein n=1 Tax=Catenovulum sediminis TaxID=1740262 RepID=A0ABV1RKF2_9ALTE|nr:hypothetical protein [Catenovulum sediminis]